MGFIGPDDVFFEKPGNLSSLELVGPHVIVRSLAGADHEGIDKKGIETRLVA